MNVFGLILCVGEYKNKSMYNACHELPIFLLNMIFEMLVLLKSFVQDLSVKRTS